MTIGACGRMVKATDSKPVFLRVQTPPCAQIIKEATPVPKTGSVAWRDK